MSYLLTYLIGVIALQVSLNALIIAFTSPSSLLRLMSLPLVVLCVHQVLPICLEATGRVIWAALLGAHSITFLFQYLDTALLTKWSAEVGGPTADQNKETIQSNKGRNDRQSLPTRKIAMWDRLRFGYYAAVSTRNVGYPFEVSGVPHFSSNNPTYVPSRRTFLREKASLLLSCYLVLDLLTLASQPDQNPVLYRPSNISWSNAGNRSVERLVIRSASTFGFWLSLYCIIQAYMGSMAFLSVALGFSEVNSWRPGFGPISEAYSVRRFWGIFWHKYQQQKMSSPASFVTNSVLGLPKGTPVSRYTHLFLTFFISGLMHAMTDLAEGFTWQQSGSLRFFCTQAVGIIVEDGIRTFYRWALPNWKQASTHQTFNKILGYIWVVIFMVWSTPAWIYPSLYANKGEDKDLIVPFSLVRAIYENMKSLRT